MKNRIDEIDDFCDMSIFIWRVCCFWSSNANAIERLFMKLLTQFFSCMGKFSLVKIINNWFVETWSNAPRQNIENVRFNWISWFLTLLKYVFSRLKLIKHNQKNVFSIIMWNMIDFMNVLKLIKSIDDVVFISKMKLADFVVL